MEQLPFAKEHACRQSEDIETKYREVAIDQPRKFTRARVFARQESDGRDRGNPRRGVTPFRTMVCRRSSRDDELCNCCAGRLNRREIDKPVELYAVRHQ